MNENKPFEYKMSPHIDRCKTKEEWDKECERWRKLTPEQRQQESAEHEKKFYEELAKKNAEWDNKKQEEKQKKEQNAEDFFKNCDHPNSLENSEATILCLIVMGVGSIFKGNWVIWIVATIIWWRYINRHKKNK